LTGLEAGHIAIEGGKGISEDLPGRVGDRSGEPCVVNLRLVLALGERNIKDRLVRVVGRSGDDLPSEAVVDLSIGAAGVSPAASELECTLAASTGRVKSDIFGGDSVGKGTDIRTVDVLLFESKFGSSISSLVSDGETDESSSNKGFHSLYY